MVPGISMGHNGTAAFGLTIFGHDQEDLCCYRTDPADPDLYFHKDGWRRMDVLHESVPVRGHPDQQVALRFTCHGPVVHRKGAVRRAPGQWRDTPGPPAGIGQGSSVSA